MTNADKIRSLTNEELERFLSRVEIGDIDMAVTYCDMCEKDGGNALGLDCDGCRLHWLNSEANNIDW